MALASALQRVHLAFVARIDALQRAPHSMTAADARADALRRLGELRASSGAPFGVKKVVAMVASDTLWVPRTGGNTAGTADGDV